MWFFWSTFQPQFFLNIEVCFNFLIFLDIEMAQVVAILPDWRQGAVTSVHPTYSILMIAWQYKEPGHHQPRYWPHFGIFSTISFNTLRLRQNGRHFPDDIFKSIFLNENVSISIKISLKFVPKGQINNIPAMVQIVADQATSHYLNQWWLVYWRIYASLGLNELKMDVLLFLYPVSLIGYVRN